MKRQGRGFFLPGLTVTALLIWSPFFVPYQISLQEALHRFLSEPALKGAWVGVVVETAGDRPRRLLSHDAEKRFLPASNMKLFTAALVLEQMGPDFIFTTPVLMDGERTETGIEGHLYLKGVGDPSLDRERLKELAKGVAKAGIREVKGSLIVDVSAFTDARWGKGWAWDYRHHGYAAEVWAIALGRNSIYVTIAPAKEPNSPAIVSAHPKTDWLFLDNHLITTDAKEGKWWVWREAWERRLHLWGQVPQGSKPVTVRVSVPFVPYYVGVVFRTFLEGEGVKVRGDVKLGRVSREATLLAETKSPPLRDLIRRMMKVSDNLYAEMLLRVVAHLFRGEGTVAGARSLLRERLRCWGINPDEVFLSDGSGLSRLNMVTPDALVRLLQAVRTRPWFPVFWESLPVAGSDGTLAHRFKGTVAEGRVIAKTGYLKGVVALSGYLRRRDGMEWVFSVLINHFTAPARQVRKALDRFIIALLTAEP